MTTRSNTEQLLKENEKLRNSDLYLYFAYVQQYHNFVLTPEQKVKLNDLPTFETITRIRRDLRGQYPGSEVTEKERYAKYIEMRDEYGNRYMKEIFE